MNKFKGKYYKHQIGNYTICFIVGKTKTEKFLQIITNNKVHHFNDFSNCSFSVQKISIDLPTIRGDIRYHNITPLKSNIMGPFRFIPLQCKHSIDSMHHDLSGSMTIDGKYYDFDGGIGYIEGDYGYSFPKNYLWLNCNDFPFKLSITVAIATIPLLLCSFTGCICAIVHGNKQYILATYNRAKIKKRTTNSLVIVQKNYRLEIEILSKSFQPLKMPVKGKMIGVVHESINSAAHFRFYDQEQLIFDETSENVSFEYNYDEAK